MMITAMGCVPPGVKIQYTPIDDDYKPMKIKYFFYWDEQHLLNTEKGTLALLTKDMLAADTWEIMCAHPKTEVEFKDDGFQCRICKEWLEPIAFKAKPRLPAMAPEQFVKKDFSITTKYKCISSEEIEDLRRAKR